MLSFVVGGTSASSPWSYLISLMFAFNSVVVRKKCVFGLTVDIVMN